VQQQLHYSLPQQIGRLLHQQTRLSYPHTLDLGCGTGLSGTVLRELSSQLIGVDIAPKMLAVAQEKGIYDKLIEAEIIQFLRHDKQTYDLIVAADVLPYLGDLSALLSVLVPRLNQDGLFIFSIEISYQPGFVLQETARFAHHPDYVAQLCQQFDLRIVQSEQIMGRLQEGKPLTVMVYLCGT
jgi:predicted TPR repeat methyltransferase